MPNEALLMMRNKHKMLEKQKMYEQEKWPKE
jgi:hypothetical protein